MLVLVLVNIASLNIVHNHFCFNDYMERIISSTESQYFHYLHLYLHSFELIVIPCQGSMARTWSRWGSTMRVRRTTWTASSSAPTSSGTVRSSTQTLRTWWKRVYVSEYQVKQEEAHPRPDTALVSNIIPFFNTVTLCFLVLIND